MSWLLDCAIAVLAVLFGIWLVRKIVKKIGKRQRPKHVPMPSKTEHSCCSYVVKESLMTPNEWTFYRAIKEILCDRYILVPQVNLATILTKISEDRYQNELYRNMDFCIFDHAYHPLVVLEINDSTHDLGERKKRDEKVRQICTMANLPLIVLWTHYGVIPEYIRKRLSEYLVLEGEKG